jgi:quercetin dioxygenase-like cupin family protein
LLNIDKVKKMEKQKDNKIKDEGFSRDLNEVMEFPREGIFSKVLAKSDTYNYTLMCLAKGTDIDTHTSTKAGVVQVIKGEGTFTLFGKKIIMKPGVFIFMPKNAPHALNAKDDLAILLCLTT